MRAVAAAIGMALSLGTAQAQPAPAPASAPLQIREVGSMHVGGRVATIEGLPSQEIVFSPGAPPLRINPNGQFMVEGMYAQYIRLAEPRARFPLLMWHGGGLTGATWETTPDGRPGWQMFFLRQGHDVWVSDAVERGRSGFARSPQVFAGEPVFRTMGEGWGLFRVGPNDGWNAEAGQRRAFPDSRFPVAAWDQFTRQSVPRWVTTDRQIQAAYDAYVQQACPCVIVVHSQGGNFAFNAALNAPDKVRAIIAIEPSGAPPAGADAARLRDVPHLIVWGDHFADSPFWTNIRTNVERWAGAIREAGGRADILDLPAAGLRGNSHMMMMDTNSDEVAGRIQAWMTERGLMR
ncbi:alpha/beta fold hydrolase [Muricoccus radiodurans]|uniref:alpha/beta fold hydrolase n=1 Tax=Muricoccus radiodurans TaxID=2231721 RepID=UPI003CEFC1B6